ncbi:MAG: hypothetical protein NTV28_16710 [Propionibacteriales bacterium]|jgi:hypothetical protein|uniref:hypothetical protein n=1 Tax=unclassified Aeromicrobium TaxID=2633570 RepID=UPI002097476A|nr:MULTISPECIES: hypothetical protein [unclassified Aeromicrobium]MCO7238422.1 hypothetical protein [Aeromicrobium sp. CnD17-E]MCX6408555.1 hypothetical protein [Propionibacteriales bacterium]MDR6118853.1 hypothetical protein [Aeromicrobium sp. SORGH_AS_0981]
MPRRVSMPGADELFRPTAPSARSRRPAPDPSVEPDQAEQEPAGSAAPAAPRDSGRIKHDEKMTVYVTSEELLAIEQARLQLRSSVRRNVDRGRLVRAAIALALEDLETRGDDSDLARRLGSA